MAPSIITLTTDFGTGSPYVAQIKAVVLRIDPQAVLVDITHQVPPQDVRQGALVLEDVAPLFPEGTTHVCVVDPGVGTSRKIVLAEIDRQYYIAPDNGVLSRVLHGASASRALVLTREQYWLHPVSDTFHGRDIMAPVAARLAAGAPPEDFGAPVERLEMLDWPKPQADAQLIRGVVLVVDSFGNLITNIDRGLLEDWGDPASLRVECAGHTIDGIVRAYGERPPGMPVALFGSSHRLEVSVVMGSAAARLQARPGDQVVVRR